MFGWALYTLFGDDICMVGTNKSTDVVFYSLTIIAIVLFSTEIILSSIVKPDYLFGFYFWLGTVTTLTMLMDIGWLWDPVISLGYSDPPNRTLDPIQLSKYSY